MTLNGGPCHLLNEISEVEIRQLCILGNVQVRSNASSIGTDGRCVTVTKFMVKKS